MESIDLCHEANGLTHHTNQFHLMKDVDNKSLVVRRGQPFKLQLNLNRAFVPNVDSIYFIFSLNGNNQDTPGNGTFMATPLQSPGCLTDSSDKWSCINNGNYLDLLFCLITPPANAPIGEWSIRVDTGFIGGTDLHKKYEHPSTFILLFNPWCIKDQVYMSGKIRIILIKCCPRNESFSILRYRKS